MSRKPPICKLCRERPAEVPDRNRPSTMFRREICRECHADRLRGDLVNVLHAAKAAAPAPGGE